jgi:hypothetical protein
MDLAREMPELGPKGFVSIVEVWKAELVALRRNPAVRKFLELQDKIDKSDDGIPFPSSRTYDLYDVFEFGRDLAGRQMSTERVTRMALDRFPETSDEGRRAILQFLVDHEYAEVTRRTTAGRPVSYRFAPPREGGRGLGLTVLTNELSRFKAEDLEDIVRVPLQDPRRPSE